MRTTSGNDWIWISTRWAIYARDHFTCIACGAKESLSLDHVAPGKDNRPTNLVTLCVSCNSSKCARPLLEWRPELADEIAIQCASPLDRALGRALAEEMRPSRIAALRFRDSQRKARTAARASVLASPFSDLE